MGRLYSGLEPVASIAPTETPTGRGNWFSVTVYSIVLFWINFYICRDLLSGSMAAMNSMHGFWAAIATHAGDSWFHANWWPYWDGGIPFEFTYAPLAPALTALGTSAFHVSPVVAFQFVSALAYSLAPVTLFLMAWVMTRAPGYSFLAGVLYSLTAPTRLLVPDDVFHWQSFWDARRLYLVASWDDTPHVLALVFIPLAILFLVLSIQRRRLIYYVAASVSIAAAALASAFGPTVVIMAAFCLLFVLRRRDYWVNTMLVAAIGAYAWALSARFLPPSLFHAIGVASGRGETGNWSAGSVTALAIVMLGWVILWHYLQRWTKDWTLQFFALFAWLMSSPSLIATYLNRHLLPQPNRYKFEMEVAIALLVVFVARCWVRRAPRALQAALLFLFLALAGEQIVSYREYAKNDIRSSDLSTTIEYRAARWAEQNLPGTRILMPGSMAQWTNTFSGVQQISGSSWSMAYNTVQQRGLDAMFDGGDTPERDARVSLAWLKAYGAGAVCVSGPKSPEFWKPYRRPLKFEGLLPVLWREDDTTIYRIPQRTTSLAHVVPPSAIVGPDLPRHRVTLAEIERYDAALEDASLPGADFQWQGSNRILIHTQATPEQAIAVQVSWHPGWHATEYAAGGDRHPVLQKDGLGLMWLRPDCNGQCVVQLDYDGGWELRLTRWLSYLALAVLCCGFPFWYFWSRTHPSADFYC